MDVLFVAWMRVSERGKGAEEDQKEVWKDKVTVLVVLEFDVACTCMVNCG